MHKLAKQIKAKVPAILTNIVLLFAVYMVAVLLVPSLQGIGLSIPGLGMSAGVLLSAVLLIVGVYFGLKIFTDVLSLAETASETFVDMLPWVKEGREKDVQKAFKEIVAAIVVILLLQPLAQMVGLIPYIGVIITQYVVIAVVIGIVLLLFDAGKIFYVELNEWSKKVASTLAGEAEKLEEKAEKEKKTKKKK